MRFRALLSLARRRRCLSAAAARRTSREPKPVERKEETVDKLPQARARLGGVREHRRGRRLRPPAGLERQGEGSGDDPDRAGRAGLGGDHDRPDRRRAGRRPEGVRDADRRSSLPVTRSRSTPARRSRSGTSTRARSSRRRGSPRSPACRQRVSVIVLERKGVAVVTAVIAENAERERGRRVEAGGGGDPHAPHPPAQRAQRECGLSGRGGPGRRRRSS